MGVLKMIGELLVEWLKKQRPFSESGPFSTNSSESKARKEVMLQLKEELETLIADHNLLIGQGKPKIDRSRGITLDTNVPWLRFFDDRTPRPTEGWSLVLFASQDGSSVSLGIGLGVYRGTKKRDTVQYTNRILDDSEFPPEIRKRPRLGPTGIASSYESGTPLSITWQAEELSSLTDEAFANQLENFMKYHDDVLNRYPPMKLEGKIAELSGKWLIQFNPAFWDFDALLEAGHNQFSFKIGYYKDIIQEGDPVVIWRAGSRAGIVAVGTVSAGPEDRTSDDITSSFYKVEADREEVTTRIQIEVQRVFEEPIPKSALLELMARNTILTAPQSTSPFPVSDEEYDGILRLGGLALEKKSKLSMEELSENLLMPISWLESVTQEIREKKQVIFQGPPGTGKTFIATAISKHLADGHALVQFHPSYAYEDFVEGFRPVKHGDSFSFELKPGPLVAMANEARSKPDQTFVLIIDEINRGNLAKVFGELYFLLEYRNEEATMQYRSYGETFALPDNLLIIGTMNTADRSISSLDLAIRRRFSFIELVPDREPVKGLLNRWLSKQDYPTNISAMLDHVNSMILDSRVKLGPSYFMKSGIVEDLEKTWNYQVFPQLKEVFFDNEDVLESLTFDAVSRATGIR